MNKIFKVGLIGCGHISETYFRAQEYFNNIRIVKCADINVDAAKKCAIHYNIEAVTVEELLKDKEIEIILYLNSNKIKHNVLDLQKNIWKYSSDLETHTVETHIYRLRKKISQIFNNNEFILSKKNGYQIK